MIVKIRLNEEGDSKDYAQILINEEGDNINANISDLWLQFCHFLIKTLNKNLNKV